MWAFLQGSLGAVPSWARVIILCVIAPALVCITAWFIYTVTLSITAAMQNGREVEIRSIGLSILSNCQTLRDAIPPLTKGLDNEGSEWKRNLDEERLLQTELRLKALKEIVGSANQELTEDIGASRSRAERITGISSKIDDVKDRAGPGNLDRTISGVGWQRLDTVQVSCFPVVFETQ
jgi:hypothetical protein